MPWFVLAPFLLAAGLLFTILSLVPRVRRWGIPIPTGILSAAPSFFVALIGLSLAEHLPGLRSIPQNSTMDLIVLAIVAVAGGAAAGFAAYLVASLLPAPLLRAAVFVAAWCSYFVLIVAAEITGGQIGWPRGNGLVGLVLEALLSFIGAFFIATRSEEFRPRNLRLPWGTTFRRRGENSTGSATQPDRA
jgi:hypothetical protein